MPDTTVHTFTITPREATITVLRDPSQADLAGIYRHRPTPSDLPTDVRETLIRWLNDCALGARQRR